MTWYWGRMVGRELNCPRGQLKGSRAGGLDDGKARGEAQEDTEEEPRVAR